MLHVAFSYSGRGALVHLFRNQPGLTVVGLADDFSLGPIDNPLGEKRMSFWKEIALPGLFDPDVSFHEEWYQQTVQFWEIVLKAETMTLWFSSFSAPELCGMMMVLDQLKKSNATIRLLDVGHYAVQPPEVEGHSATYFPSCVAEIQLDDLHKLQDHSKELFEESRTNYLKQWHYLQHQEWPMRWLYRNQLTPMAWSELDKFIMLVVSDCKLPAAKVVGSVLEWVCRDYHQCSDVPVWYCLSKLIHQGVLNHQDATFSHTDLVWRNNKL